MALAQAAMNANAMLNNTQNWTEQMFNLACAGREHTSRSNADHVSALLALMTEARMSRLSLLDYEEADA